MKAPVPRKMLLPALVPTLVSERLAIWGNAIRTQRVRQRITADQLCVRIGLSRATLSRIERGDAAVSAAGYMSAFLVLGILDQAMPPLPPTLWLPKENGRVKARREEGDDDYF